MNNYRYESLKLIQMMLPIKLFAGKVYNKQACLCTYMITISTTIFIDLMCVYRAK